jgi:hypothetical protein
MEFTEAASFTRWLLEAMTDDDYRTLQSFLAERPDTGLLIRGGGGLRKIRWKGKGTGKRGGVRIIYYWDGKWSTTFLVGYRKGKKDNLSQKELTVLRKLIKD